VGKSTFTFATPGSDSRALTTLVLQEPGHIMPGTWKTTASVAVAETGVTEAVASVAVPAAAPDSESAGSEESPPPEHPAMKAANAKLAKNRKRFMGLHPSAEGINTLERKPRIPGRCNTIGLSFGKHAE
jgi:hypothetical protein